MLFPPPPVPPAPAKFLLTHEITMFSQLVNEFIVSLAGIFAALLWLNPGKSAAIRYAMILVPAGALYVLLMQEAMGWQYQMLLHVKYSAVVLLFLLGVFMLKCPWRRVVLSFGIYSLVCSVAGLMIAAFDVPELLLSLTRYLIFEYAWVWVFIWLCSRKSEMGGKWISLLASGSYLTLCGLIFTNLRGCVALGDVLVCANIIISLLGLLFVLRYVMLQVWKRSLITSFLYITPMVLSHILLWYSISNMEVN